MKNSTKRLLAAGFFILSLFLILKDRPFNSIQSASLGATIPTPVANFTTSLANSISASETSMTLVSIAVDGGSTLINGGTYGFVIDEGTSNQETVIGILNTSDNTVSSLLRGVSPTTGNTEVASLKKTHRRGASVKITDHPVLPVIARILSGDESISNTLTYDTGVTPTASGDLVDKEYADALAFGGTLSYDRLVVAGNAGATVAAGNIVYLDSSDTEWKLADADASATSENVMLGIAQGAGTDGGAITSGVLLRGLDTNQTGLSTNTKYYLSGTAGALSSSAGTKEVSLGISKSTTSIYFFPNFDQKLTEDEQDALAGGGDYGTPSSSNKFITLNFLSSATNMPVTRTYTTVSTSIGGSTTQFDITNPSGTTFRYTYDSTGTDPTINCTANPIGSLVNLQAQNFTSANNGIFALTGCGTNYFEVTNASGVVESNKTIGTGYIVESGTTGWTKPTGLKYISVRLVGGGGGASGLGTDEDASTPGGGGGGYSEEVIQASSLSSTEYYIVGAGGTGSSAGNTDGGNGRITVFGNKLLYATGGEGADVDTSNDYAGKGGFGYNGSFNTSGGGGSGGNGGVGNVYAGAGGASMLGGGGRSHKDDSTSGETPAGYGGGGGGVYRNGSGGSLSGGSGAQGIIILTEYFQ